MPLWFTKFKAPIYVFIDTSPTKQEIINIHKMKSSGSPNPLDQILITVSEGNHIFGFI